MGNFFKSRAFIVLLTLLVILCGVPAILTAMGQGNAVKDGIMAVVTPAMRGARALGDACSGFGE